MLCMLVLASGERKYHIVEASHMESVFDRFMESIYGTEPTGLRASPAWHQHNAIFLLNPSKVRINPTGDAQAATHRSPDFIADWKR